MKNSVRTWCLVLGALCCLIPVSFADQDGIRYAPRHPHEDFREVPEGGSTAVYLLGAGLTCVGAMFLRSKASKAARSKQA